MRLRSDKLRSKDGEPPMLKSEQQLFKFTLPRPMFFVR